jgi:hypothetical protein
VGNPEREGAVSAAEYEAALALEAEQLRGNAWARGNACVLDSALYLQLWPLLCRPIPAEYIETVGVVKGKPYESTGIRSVQVQIDRMNNVLTPLWWEYRAEHSDAGTICLVTVSVFIAHPEGLVRTVSRSSHGGVDRGSTLGNVYKGSFTNAAKRAFAAHGPGHEVYLGDVDLDPDVSESMAQTQDARRRRVPRGTLSRAQREKVVQAYAEAGITGRELSIYLKAAGVDTPEELTAPATLKMRELLDAELERRAAKETS